MWTSFNTTRFIIIIITQCYNMFLNLLICIFDTAIVKFSTAFSAILRWTTIYDCLFLEMTASAVNFVQNNKLKLWTVTICSVNTKYIPFTLTPKKRKNYASSSKSSLQSSYVDVITLPLDLIVCLVFDINWYKLMIIYRTNFNRIKIVVCKSTSCRFETDERNKFTNE